MITAIILRAPPYLFVPRRETEVKVEYLGFEVPNLFVVGYGIDFAHQYRNLPYVAVVTEQPHAERPAEAPPDPS